jgi:TonB-dependent SusC/RagA subfamily outer membrane receptor
MMATWMLQALLVAVLVGAAARAAEELFRLYGLPRRLVWAAAILATVLLPVWMLAAPMVPGAGGGAPAAATPEAYAGSDAGANALTSMAVAPGAASWTGLLAERVSAAAAVLVAGAAGWLGAATLERALLGGWLALSAGFLSLFLLTLVRYSRLRRHWRAARLADTEVYVASRGGPAVVGVVRPAIVVPAWLLRAEPSHQRMVVLHEREHVRARDHILVAFAHAVVALMPWNVPLHWMLRRLRLTVELDCDRRVLAGGAEPRAYGTMLLDIAGHAEGLPLATATLADGPTDLERRILDMTTKQPRFRSIRAGLATAVAAALVVVACDVDLTDPALQDATVAEALTLAAENNPTLAPLALDARYYLDGEQVALDAIGDVAVKELARVEVRKPLVRDGVAAPAEVHITSTAAALAGGEQPARLPLVRGQAGEARTEAVRVAAARAAQDTATARLREVRASLDTIARVRVQPAGVVRETGAVTVRGAANMAASAAPLMVIDGVIISGGMPASLDPADIEKIEIIKGALAAQLYGARAANGVIMITTRR